MKDKKYKEYLNEGGADDAGDGSTGDKRPRKSRLAASVISLAAAGLLLAGSSSAAGVKVEANGKTKLSLGERIRVMAQEDKSIRAEASENGRIGIGERVRVMAQEKKDKPGGSNPGEDRDKKHEAWLEKQAEIKAAIEANDYDRWLAAVGAESAIALKINTPAKFSQFVQAYNLRVQSNNILKSLGLFESFKAKFHLGLHGFFQW